MIIRHKGIEHNIYGEAPFVATRICSIQCHNNCPGCQNEELKHDTPIIEESSEDIIKKILDDPFDEGLVLGGLEWTEQPEEMFSLICAAQRCGLKVMLYTHLNRDNYVFRFGIPNNIYIKYGEFIMGDTPHTQYGVRLISSNQHIVKYN